MSPVPVRTLAVWCPDWPVVAAAQSQGTATDATSSDTHEVAMAVIDAGRVHACSQAARVAGVRRGLRVREAQARCPEVVTIGYDPIVDARAFEPVVAAIEELAPNVEIVRPGVACVGARGPSGYFGGDGAAVAALSKRLAALDVIAQIGIADGPFAAIQAARHGVVVPPGESASWLAPLPIDVLDRPELISLLRRLGLRTLGAFAALPASQVLTRFGVDGAQAHQLAGGHDGRMLAARKPPPELTVHLDLDPPVDRIDTVAFSVRADAGKFVAGLAERELVCTCLRVEIESDRGELLDRCWRHPRWFNAADVVDRVRWQLGHGSASSTTPALTAPVARVTLVPEEVDRAGSFTDGLWGERAPDEDVHRAVSRVQSLLGHQAAVTAVPAGGRGPAERVTLVPWGDQRAPDRPADQPWPGRLPAPAPTVVWSPPRPVRVLDTTGRAVVVNDRALVSAPPAWLQADGPAGEGTSVRARAGAEQCGPAQPVPVEPEPIVAWAGPWPVDERWWDATAARRLVRFQVVLADGRAWLLAAEAGRWWIEAGYD